MTMIAKYLGIDVSTSGVTMLVQNDEGDEGFATQTFDEGDRTTVHGEPANKLASIPHVCALLIRRLAAKGWSFSEGGTLAISMRQHDTLLLDKDFEPLYEPISWQSDVAAEEADSLNASRDVVTECGPVAARYAVCKAMWLLKQAPDLRAKVGFVCLTGDYINFALTGELYVSSSDGRSNGLVSAVAPIHAVNTFKQAGLDPNWLPIVNQSGDIVSTVQAPDQAPSPIWSELLELLQGWHVAACIGDNHAGAAGFTLADEETLCLSAGTSGTAVRLFNPLHFNTLKRQVLCMEYFDRGMLLDMLPRCCEAYDAWYDALHRPPTHQDIDQDALKVLALSPEKLVTLRGNDSESFPDNWHAQDLSVRAAHLQVSLAGGLLKCAQAVIAESDRAEPIRRFLLTGGLANAPLFRHAIVVGAEQLAPGCRVLISQFDGPARYQMAARGALLTAMLPDNGGKLEQIAKLSHLCPTQGCEDPGEHRSRLQPIMQHLLA